MTLFSEFLRQINQVYKSRSPEGKKCLSGTDVGFQTKMVGLVCKLKTEHYESREKIKLFVWQVR